MTVVVNPKSFSVGDANVAAEGVTSFKMLVGTATGGPYTVSSASVPVSSLTLNGSVYTGNWSLLNFSPALSPFVTYFAVAEAVNAEGASGNSPEASFSLETAPSAPTSLALS
jgi:uncharacterized membrane protein